MDKFLSDVMYRNIPEAWTKQFINTTDCVHRVFNVLDTDGKILQKENNGNFYPIRSCFLPVEEPDDLKDPQKVIQLVNKVADALWQTIDKKKYKWTKEEELPRIVDYNRDVRTVTNYSDIFAEREDSLTCMALACKQNEVKFSDWIRSDGDDNVYTLFKHGKVDPELVAKWNLPFDSLKNEDKQAYKQYKEATDKNINNLTNRELGPELSQEQSENATT